jgi:subtilase family serine protease
MIMVLNMAPEQRHNAMTLLDSQQTKGSPNYHRWLTPEQYGQQFGAAPEDIAQVSAWLQQQGFAVSGVAKSGMWIEFSGTVGLANRAFHTQIRRYKVNGENHIANMADISIPAALAPVVKGVPLHDLFSKPAFVRSADLPAITNSAGVHAITPGDFAAIYDLAPLYKSNLNGSGQTIAILSKSDVNLSDVAQFQKIFGLPSNVPNVIDNGASPGVTPVGGYGVEASLDAEWAAAVAPGAKIDVVASWDTYTTDGVLLSAMYVVDHNLAQIVNVSFTACEQNMGEAGNALWNGVWQQAAAQGMSVFVASGDAGAADCDSPGLSVLVQGPAAVNGLSSTPFNTSVGGTEFDETVNSGKDTTFWNKTNGTDLASAIGYIPEMVWNDTCPGSPYCPPPGSFYIPFFSGGGGGVSTIYPTPAWQTLNVTGLDVLKNYSLPGQAGVAPRGIPDVSLAAASMHDPFLFCFTDPFHPENPDCQLEQGTFGPNTFQNAGGGTSFASPAFAGLMAIINQKMAASNPSPDGRQGLANYMLYSLAASEDFGSCNSSARTDPSVAPVAACTFNDITVGDNHAGSYAGAQISYSAGAGYDLASGLGSVDSTNLVNNWSSASANFHGSQTTLSTTSSSPISINHGQSATFDVSVTKLSGDSTAQAPSGNISLIAERGTSSVGVTAAPLASGNPATTGNFSTTNLPGGSYNLVANFPGDGHFAGSVSNAIPVTVAPEATTTTLYGYATEPYGTQLIDYSAGVVGSTGQGYPSGMVTLTDGGTAFAQIKLNNEGVATFLSCNYPGGILTPAVSPLPCLIPGVHVISATYAGDDSFSPSPTPPAATQTLTVTITQGAPFMQLWTASKGPNTIEESFTLTTYLGSVSPAAIPPTGTIVFSEGSNVLGQASVVSTPGAAPQAAIQGTFSGQAQHHSGLFGRPPLRCPDQDVGV